MYEEELKELGLTDNEVKVYLALLRNKILNPTKLAEKTGQDKKEVDKAIKALMKEEKVFSPKRCFYSAK